MVSVCVQNALAATLVDDGFDGLDAPDAGGGLGSFGLSSHLVSICEAPLMPRSPPRGDSGTSAPMEVAIGLVAIDAATASVVHDCFHDGPGRPALEARLAQLQPQEVLAPEPAARGPAVLSTETEQLLLRLQRGELFAGVGCRLERRLASDWDYAEAIDGLTAFYKEGELLSPAEALQTELAMLKVAPRPMH